MTQIVVLTRHYQAYRFKYPPPAPPNPTPRWPPGYDGGWRGQATRRREAAAPNSTGAGPLQSFHKKRERNRDGHKSRWRGKGGGGWGGTPGKRNNTEGLKCERFFFLIRRNSWPYPPHAGPFGCKRRAPVGSREVRSCGMGVANKGSQSNPRRHSETRKCIERFSSAPDMLTLVVFRGSWHAKRYLKYED